MSTHSTDLTFGPPSAQWIYSTQNKTYDLTRSQNTPDQKTDKLKIQTTEGPEAWIEVAVGLSALVVVDMQNFFLDGEHPLGLAAIEPTIRVIEKCREVGIQVIWLNWGLTDHDMATMPAGVQRGFSRSLIESSSSPKPSSTPQSADTQPAETQQPVIKTGLGADLGNNKGRTLFAGSWNADIYSELKKFVREEDVHCAKNRMSGLWCEEQPLWKYIDGKWNGIEGNGIAGKAEGNKRKETLFFTGVNTDQCVLGTLSNAYNAGWDCVMINDCCATTTVKGKEVCVHNVSNSYGFVVDSETFCAGTSG